MDDRANRVLENENQFRALNEGVLTVEARVRDRDEGRFICECARPDCTEVIAISLAEYREIHSQPNCFMIRKGHVVADVEDVVREDANYDVVKKRKGGTGAEAG
jgi:hypothetical protein